MAKPHSIATRIALAATARVVVPLRRDRPDGRAPRLIDRRAAVLAVGIVAVDQATKTAAPHLASGPLGGLVHPVFNPEFTLGVASASYTITLLAAGVMLLGFGGYTWQQARRGLLGWPVPALLVGGAVANLADRVAFGAVRDFLLTPWAVINVADVAVVAGLLAYAARRWSHRRAAATTSATDAAATVRAPGGGRVHRPTL